MTAPTARQPNWSGLSTHESLRDRRGWFAQLEFVGAEGLEPPACWL